MYFKLKTFAKKEIRKYEVIRQSEYDINNPVGSEENFIFPMLIYKKSLKVITPNQDGIRKLNQLNGKIEKIYDLRLYDTIIFNNKKYRVVELLPRVYSDFNEFVLELVENEK